MDGFTSGYRVATALRIVYWPSLSILGLMLRGQFGCSSKVLNDSKMKLYNIT